MCAGFKDGLQLLNIFRKDVGEVSGRVDALRIQMGEEGGIR